MFCGEEWALVLLLLMLYIRLRSDHRTRLSNGLCCESRAYVGASIYSRHQSACLSVILCAGWFHTCALFFCVSASVSRLLPSVSVPQKKEGYILEHPTLCSSWALKASSVSLRRRLTTGHTWPAAVGTCVMWKHECALMISYDHECRLRSWCRMMSVKN